MKNSFIAFYLILISTIFVGCDYSMDYDNENNDDSIQLSIGSITEDYIEILYNSNAEIAGFQFAMTGITLLESASGGAAEENNFTVTIGSEHGIVLGFSLEGFTIPEGSGVLTRLAYSEIFSDICMTSIILSNSEGLQLEANELFCN